MKIIKANYNEYDILQDALSKNGVIPFSSIEEKIMIYEDCISIFMSRDEITEAKQLRIQINKIFSEVPTTMDEAVDFSIKMSDFDCESLVMFYEIDEKVVACYLFNIYRSIFFDKWLFFRYDSPISNIFDFNVSENSKDPLNHYDNFIYNLCVLVAKKLKSNKKKCRVKYKEFFDSVSIEKYNTENIVNFKNLNDAIHNMLIAIDKIPAIREQIRKFYNNIQEYDIEVATAHIFYYIRNIVFYYWRMYEKNNSLRKWFEKEKNITNIEEICYEVTKSYVSNVLLKFSLENV